MRTVKIAGNPDPCPVGKLVCVGRNYAEHARELGNEVPEKPIFFMKPSTSIIGSGEEIIIPSISSDCHHEVELAVIIGKKGKSIRPVEAMDHIAGYGVAIDLTLRDVQTELKNRGLPWEAAKAFDTACPLSDFVPASRIPDPHELRISLRVNGEIRQDSSTSLMVRRIPELLSEISNLFTLEPGDIVLTGTPEGVARVDSGDILRAEIDRVGVLEVKVR